MQALTNNPEHRTPAEVDVAIEISPERQEDLLTLLHIEKNTLNKGYGLYDSMIELLKDAYRLGFKDGPASIE